MVEVLSKRMKIDGAGKMPHLWVKDKKIQLVLYQVECTVFNIEYPNIPIQASNC